MYDVWLLDVADWYQCKFDHGIQFNSSNFDGIIFKTNSKFVNFLLFIWKHIA